MLEGVRVVDSTTGIAGSYCTKLLADAGAEVVKVEPPGGDPLRQWGSGAFFEFLNASKLSAEDPDGEFLDAADLLVAGEPVDLDRLWRQNPALVVVTVTPFGCVGPWAGRPTTEFILQAWCGATWGCGLPEGPPLAVGGRLGEWLTGTFAAIGAIAALREAQRSGLGEHVDVAMFDTMSVTMVGRPSVLESFSGHPEHTGLGRTIEVPSIEPTTDGYFVVTTNTAQQLRDFLVMIGHSELLADAELALGPTRFARREKFLAHVHEYTTKHTTAELVEEAGRSRIPAAPVLHGLTTPTFEQFVARQVFVSAPSGRFIQPRVPFRISGTTSRPFSPAPTIGEHSGTIDWRPRPQPKPGGAADPSGWRLPLADVRVIDCTAWWAGPAATHVLGCLGADVIKIESLRRPDNFRFISSRPPTEDRWYEWGAIYHGVNVDKRAITLDLTRPQGVDVFERLVRTADVLVDNFTPRVMEQFGLGWERIHALNPEMLMIRMPAFGLDGPWRDRPGFAQTMAGLTGLAWVTGFPDGPPVLVRGACDPLAGMHAVVATLLALIERDRTGGGRLVEVPMVEAALNAAAEQLVEASATGVVQERQGNRGPIAAPQGLYRCAGEDSWLALAIVTDEQWEALRSIVGNPRWAADHALSSAGGRRVQHDLIDAELESFTADKDASGLAELLMGRGLPAGAVIRPWDIVRNPQLRHRGLFEMEDHPITGRHEIPMLPFRYSRVERWLRTPAPTLGQHNQEVLEALGVEAAAIDRLRADGVIGERL